ncbi:MAG: fluoride efflux transporter CrcB [Blastocatellia bacterium]|nr:fluoride efflux transporter CrcB [Blastocatellia bacterium]
MSEFGKYLSIATGGALGAIARYTIGLLPLARWGAPFPTGTFLINVTGSFILGFFLTLTGEYVQVPENFRLAVGVGFVGAYTTFSTFEFETAKLLEIRDFTRAGLYVALSVLVGFAAVYLGAALARRLFA